MKKALFVGILAIASVLAFGGVQTAQDVPPVPFFSTGQSA